MERGAGVHAGMDLFCFVERRGREEKRWRRKIETGRQEAEVNGLLTLPVPVYRRPPGSPETQKVTGRRRRKTLSFTFIRFGRFSWVFGSTELLFETSTKLLTRNMFHLNTHWRDNQGVFGCSFLLLLLFFTWRHTC